MASRNDPVPAWTRWLRLPTTDWRSCYSRSTSGVLRRRETDDTATYWQIQVKSVETRRRLGLGRFPHARAVFHESTSFWHARGEHESYVGTFVNAWLAEAARPLASALGENDVDVLNVARRSRGHWPPHPHWPRASP